MSDVYYFVLAHGSRLLGIATSLVFAALFIWRDKLDYSPGKALLISLACFACGWFFEYAMLPMIVLYRAPYGPVALLTFEVIVGSSLFFAGGYALLIFAAYRFVRSLSAPQENA